MKRPLLLAAAILAASNLAACGLTGDLERPGPLWGHPDGSAGEAELPDDTQSNLPDLPDREDDSDADADDELLGGV